jgi:hypothetical protein
MISNSLKIFQKAYWNISNVISVIQSIWKYVKPLNSLQNAVLYFYETQFMSISF